MVRDRATCPSLFRRNMDLYNAILYSERGYAQADYRGTLLQAACHEDPLIMMRSADGRFRLGWSRRLREIWSPYREDILALNWRPAGKQLSTLEVLARQGNDGTEDQATSD